MTTTVWLLKKGDAYLGASELGGGNSDEGQNPAPPGGLHRVWWLSWHVGELQCAWGGRSYVL